MTDPAEEYEGLTDINVRSAVDLNSGHPFVVVRVWSASGRALQGTLTPEQVRDTAMLWLGVADDADWQAAVVAELERGGWTRDQAQGFLAAVSARFNQQRRLGREWTPGPC